MKIHCLMYMCTNFRVDILKKRASYDTLKEEIGHCHALPPISVFFTIFNFCPAWAIQKDHRFEFGGHSESPWTSQLNSNIVLVI